MKTTLLFLLLFMYPGKREIILFYNDSGTAVKDEQLYLLNKDKEGLNERDIIIHVYKTTEAKAKVENWNINPHTSFTFILVGKDGGEKMRADTAVSLTQLYITIDAMPMRRGEMKNRK